MPPAGSRNRRGTGYLIFSRPQFEIADGEPPPHCRKREEGQICQRHNGPPIGKEKPANIGSKAVRNDMAPLKADRLQNKNLYVLKRSFLSNNHCGMAKKLPDVIADTYRVFVQSLRDSPFIGCISLRYARGLPAPMAAMPSGGPVLPRDASAASSAAGSRPFFPLSTTLCCPSGKIPAGTRPSRFRSAAIRS